MDAAYTRGGVVVFHLWLYEVTQCIFSRGAQLCLS